MPRGHARTCRAAALGVALAAATGSACIPYAVGTTAQPTPVGTLARNGAASFIPRGVDVERSDSSEAVSVSYVNMDAEVRWGLNNSTDIGVRVPGMSGLVVNVKRRLGADRDTTRAAVALLGGAGLVNLGNHAHFEASLVASGRQRATVTPYGGVRVMQVAPLNATAVSDSPTIGLLAGARLGTLQLGISPEIGVFYDRSALGLRPSNFIVVPSFTLHGSFLRFLRVW